jgi:hypothetical protein
MIPQSLLSAMRTPGFWTRAFGETAPRDVEGVPIYDSNVFGTATIAVSRRRTLETDHDDSLTRWGLGLDRLGIARDGGDQRDPPYPDALRGIEVELIARAASIRQPALVHPGPVVALLARFAPVCDDEHETRWRQTIAAAWRWLGCERPARRYRFWDGALVPAFEAPFR